MVKKASEFDDDLVAFDGNPSVDGKKGMTKKQIRNFGQLLKSLPPGARLPDVSDFTIGDRFAIVAELVEEQDLDRVVGRAAAYAIARYRNGTDIPVKAAAALASETKIPLDWIVSGRATDASNVSVQVQPHDEGRDAPIQKLAFKVSAGSGALIIDDEADHVRFPRAIIDHAGIDLRHARLMDSFGESMRPTINDGDLLLVDVSEAATQIVEGKIYVFSVGDDAFVKRLRRIGNRVVMISDNRDTFPESEVPSEQPLRIYGRVKWAGRNL